MSSQVDCCINIPVMATLSPCGGVEGTGYRVPGTGYGLRIPKLQYPVSIPVALTGTRYGYRRTCMLVYDCRYLVPGTGTVDNPYRYFASRGTVQVPVKGAGMFGNGVGRCS